MTITVEEHGASLEVIADGAPFAPPSIFKNNDLAADTTHDDDSEDKDLDSNQNNNVYKFLLDRCDTDTTDDDSSLFSSPSEAVSAAGEAVVQFGTVVVREYERVIDSTQIYMGLSLGWDYTEAAPTPLPEQGENENADAATAPCAEKSNKKSPRLVRTNGSQRYGMLLEYGYAQKELRKATDEAAKFYKQRQKESQRDAARSLVVADNKGKKKKSSLLGSMFRR